MFPGVQLTSLHRRLYKHKFFVGTADRRASKRAFRFFLCFGGSLVNTPRMACRRGAWLVYTQSFLGVHGVMVRWPRTERHWQVMNEFTLFGFLPKCQWEKAFIWLSGQEFVKATDLYPLSNWSLSENNPSVDRGDWSKRPLFGAYQRSNWLRKMTIIKKIPI